MNKFTKLTLALAVAASLTACGGSSEGDDRYSSNVDRDSSANDTNNGTSTDTDTANTSGYVSAFITDNLSRDYSEVWVTLHEIEIRTPGGTSIKLYESVGGTPVNLSQLVDVSQLLGQQAVAAGTYTEFSVHLGNVINLVAADGTVTNANFGTGVDQHEVLVSGELIVSADQASSLTLDFDLAQFTYDAATNKVTPTVVQFTDTSRDQQAELHGTVTGVFSDRIEIESADHANTLTINVSNGTVVFDEATRTSSNTTSGIEVGDYVEVYGDYDSATSTISAASVRVDDDLQGGSYGSDNDSYYEVEGVVVSYDGSVLVLDVREANFLPGADTLSISGVSSASFPAGVAAELSVGQWLEINGQWDGQTFSANYVEIEGGLTSQERESHEYSDAYQEVEGIISSVDATAQTLVVTVSDSDDGAYMVGASVTINYSAAWLSSSAQACLVEGSYIEAKGALTSSVLEAKRIKFEGSCGSFSGYSYVDDSADERSDHDSTGSDDGTSGSDDAVSDDSSHDNYDELYGDVDHEAKGIIVALTDTQLTLQLSKVEGFNPGGNTLVVDITNAWYEDGTRATLALNRFIEVEGFWDGTILVARKVEFD